MGHDPAGRRPRVRPAQGLPGRRPPRPRLRPPHRHPGRVLQPRREGAHRGAADAALDGTRLVAGPHGEGPQASRGGPSGPLLHLPDPAAPDRRRDDGRAGRGGIGRPERLPVGAGGRDVEGSAHGHRRRGGPDRRRLAVAPLEEGQEARLRPSDHQGEGLPHRLRRRATAGGRPARNVRPEAGAGAGKDAPGACGRRLPPLRPPGGGAVQSEQGPTHRTRPLDDAPHRPRTVRQAQRPGRPGGGGPVAPAGGRGRDAPGGAVRGKGADALGQGSPGGSSGGTDHGGQAPSHPLPRRPASDATTSTWQGPAWASPH